MTIEETTGLLGEVYTEGGTTIVRVQDVYDTSIQDLWAAVTEPERLARWIGQIAGELRLGGSFQARFTSGWEGSGRVDDCDAPNRLLLTLRSGTDEQTEVEAVLTSETIGTRLVIFERGVPADQASSYGAGWQVHIEHLRASLDGRPTSDVRQRWTELAPLYQAR